MRLEAKHPAVSVIIPAYNVGWCVRKAVESVLSQTFRDFELLIVDDGSTDNTVEVLRDYDNVLSLINKPNGGLSSARNAGIRASRAEFVAFLDADDWWLPKKLETQISLLHQRPDVGFCSTAARIVDDEDQELNIWSCCDCDESLLVQLFGANASIAGSGSSVVARRYLFNQVGYFDESLCSLEDIDMWMRLATITNYRCVKEPLAVILKRAGSMSRNLESMHEATMKVMNKNRHLLPPELQGEYWRRCLASAHGDFAKWRYREGQTWGALREIASIMLLAPIGRGRLGLGLLKDVLLSRTV